MNHPHPSATPPTTHLLGFPRIGARRELKHALEAYWKGTATFEALEETARVLRRTHWQAQAAAGLSLLPSNDFSLYDHILDLSCMVGNVPERFGWNGAGEVDPDTYFAMARGRIQEDAPGGCGCHPTGGATACGMTKWFDTNYHFIVPEFNERTRFRLAGRKPMREFAEALALGFVTKPVLPGPVTYLFLGKEHGAATTSFNRWILLPELLAVYGEVLRELHAMGAEWVQLDEPVFACDLGPEHRRALQEAYAALAAAVPGLNLMVACYFGAAGQNLLSLCTLPVQAVHLDLTRGAEDLPYAAGLLTRRKILSLGVVDGRNIWRGRYDDVLPPIRQAVEKLGSGRVWLSASCSLLHVPQDLDAETALNPEIKSWLAFAGEKLTEITTLARLAVHPAPEEDPALQENRLLHAARATSTLRNRPAMRERLAALDDSALQRASGFPIRQEVQRSLLQLPAFPTTTIGSFPQTAEVRAWRAQWRKGNLSQSEYENRIESETLRCIRLQEELGLDVLVHGEFERTDMVEYFGEQMDGFAFTQNGWVQSYGSRCVKPPLIFGDVERPRAITVGWFKFAQRQTSKPMKGMLTGPVTILNWSFVRDDLPRPEVCRQIGLAIREEVLDLEAAGCRIIQIDEAALREGMPLRAAEHAAYLQWAVDAFRLAAGGVKDRTQIHTHMCYSDFNGIIQAIAAMDADVITIETSRSAMNLLKVFVDFQYPNEIGPGVYDIHSPRVPGMAEIRLLMDQARAVLPAGNLWINPDCGLKTRGWPESLSALAAMVEVARELRAA